MPADPARHLIELADQLARLHYDNRDPSAFHCAKIDIERAIRRIGRDLVRR